MAKPEVDYKNNFYQNYNQRKKDGTEGQRGSRNIVEKEHRHPESLNTTRWAMGREDLVPIGSNQAYDKFLQFWVNPAECSWSIGLRSSFQQTHGGMIHHDIFTDDPMVEHYELPILNIVFQAGIIAPQGYNHISNGDYQSPLLSHGLANFYDFLTLIDRPNVMDNGLPNYVNINYVSPTFGQRGVWLQGFFLESGVSWSDTTANPTTISSWSASFMVFKSNPPVSRLRQSYGFGK
jgi:hypothetical protein